MTEKVIDSSALAKFLLKEKGWERVREVLRERPYTLDLALKEVANALWKRVLLLKDIGAEKALELLNDLIEMKRTVLRVESQGLYLCQAFRIALDKGVTVYDALFISQALAKQGVLVTSDKRQCEVALSLGVEAIYIYEE